MLEKDKFDWNFQILHIPVPNPVSEVPRLEEWFMLNTHPSHALIARYTEELNQLPYRQKFPKLEQKNIQFWFKNRRAKCKRMNNCIWIIFLPY